MTEKKRFINRGEHIFQNREWWCSAKGEHCADVIATAMNELLKENEQLKKQLRKGEDVCSICKYQYLTKRDSDEYYIAKCKKEHIECSKDNVNYCKDFECKEDN